MAESKQQELIISEIRKVKLNEDIIGVSAPYLISTTKLKRKLLYRALDRLIDNKVIEIINFSVCPYCLNSNFHEEDVEKVVCKKCCETYTVNDIEENYRIVE